MKNNKRKKILVIGGTGFIGYHLLKKTKKLGWKSFSLSRNNPKKSRRLGNVKYLKADLKSFKKVSLVCSDNYDFVINLSNSLDNFSMSQLKKLISFFLKMNINKFIQIGSSAEYGNLKNKFLNENLTCKPISKYGKNKLKLTKNLILNFESQNFPVIVLRFFQVYGPKDNKDKIVPFVLNNCLKNRKFNLTEGFQTRDFCYVDDVINLLIKLLNSKNTKIKGNIFNIAYGKSISIRNLVQKIQKYCKGGNPKFGAKKLKKDEIIFSKSSIQKIKKILRWQPKISLDRGIKKLIQHEK